MHKLLRNTFTANIDSLGQLNLLLLAVVAALSTMANSIVVPLLPIYAHELRITPLQIGLLIGAFGVIRFLTQPILGSLSDRIGHKKLIQYMLALFAISGLGYGLSNLFLPLLLFRCVQAVAVGGLSIAIRAYIANVTTKSNRGQINGIVSSMQNAGSLLGPVLGGLVAEWASIQIPFYLLTFITILCFSLSSRLPPEKREFYSQSQSMQGSRKSHTKGWSKPLILIGTIHILEFAGLGLWLTVWPIYALEVLNWTSGMIGASFSVAAFASLITAPGWGKISDKYGRTLSGTIGLALLALQPVVIILFNNVEPLLWLTFVFAGVGGTAYFNAYFTLVGDLSPVDKIGYFQGTLSSGAQLSNSAGAFLAPFLWKALSLSAPLWADAILLAIGTTLFTPLLLWERKSRSKVGRKSHESQQLGR